MCGHHPVSSDCSFLYVLPFVFIPGLNLQSQFNLDNITVFNKNEQESTLGQKVKLLTPDNDCENFEFNVKAEV